jgi:hypothetical protein
VAPDETPLESEAKFQAELKALLRRAYDSGIDVEGGWDCRNGPEQPDWEAVITEVVKSERSD